MSELVQIQEAFADAVLNPAVSVPACVCGAMRLRAERRFAVYRNNVAAGLVSALGARFPVVKRLVGTEFFRAMATAYIGKEPPRTPVLIYYGDTFPTFIDSFEPAAPVPYLGDVARLELARGLAYHAADVHPASAADFKALPLNRLEDVRVRLHPSASVVRSHYPVFSIWRVNYNPDRVVPISPWAPEISVDRAADPTGGHTPNLGRGRDVYSDAGQGPGDGPGTPGRSQDFAEIRRQRRSRRIDRGQGCDRVRP